MVLINFFIASSLYALQDYIQLAHAFDWKGIVCRYKTNKNLRILDIGCGTGRWIDEFYKVVATNKHVPAITFDLVDPSNVALNEAAVKVNNYFTLGNTYQSTIQEVQLQGHYDIIWAVHSFYALAKEDLILALKKCFDLLQPNGCLIIVIASKNSFYFNFYKMFRSYFFIDQANEYQSSEQISSIAQGLGWDMTPHIISYCEPIEASNTVALSHFLFNECVGYSFNRDENEINKIGLKKIVNHPELGLFLRGYKDRGMFKFKQDIGLLILKKF